MKQKTSSPSFADMFLVLRKVRQTFFSQIDQIVDWNPIRCIIETAYTKGCKSTGRPGYDSLVLFKTDLLRTWYGLSDGEIEDQVNDRLSFSRFVGLGMDDCAPYSTTVCRFQNTLAEAGLHDAVLNEINYQLEAKGVIVKRGAIVDASITDTTRRPRGRKGHPSMHTRAMTRQRKEKRWAGQSLKAASCTRMSGQGRLRKGNSVLMLPSVRLGTGWDVPLVLYTDGFLEEWQDMWDWQRHMRST